MAGYAPANRRHQVKRNGLIVACIVGLAHEFIVDLADFIYDRNR